MRTHQGMVNTDTWSVKMVRGWAEILSWGQRIIEKYIWEWTLYCHKAVRMTMRLQHLKQTSHSHCPPFTISSLIQLICSFNSSLLGAYLVYLVRFVGTQMRRYNTQPHRNHDVQWLLCTIEVVSLPLSQAIDNPLSTLFLSFWLLWILQNEWCSTCPVNGLCHSAFCSPGPSMSWQVAESP